MNAGGELERIRTGQSRSDAALCRAVKEELERLLDSGARVSIQGVPWDSRKLTVNFPADRVLEIDLTNLALEIRRLPAGAAATSIERFVAETIRQRDILFNDGSSWDALSPDSVLPVIRNAEMVAGLRGRGADPFVSELSSCGTLYVAMVADAPGSLRLLSVEEARAMGREEGCDLGLRALENLRRQVERSETFGLTDVSFMGAPTGLVSATLDECYESSLVFLPAFLENLVDRHLPGSAESVTDVALALPSRDRLLAVSRRDPIAVTYLRRLASVLYKESAYAISDKLYSPSGGRLDPLD